MGLAGKMAVRLQEMAVLECECRPFRAYLHAKDASAREAATVVETTRGEHADERRLAGVHIAHRGNADCNAENAKEIARGRKASSSEQNVHASSL